jgi:hypothetical protein
VVGLTDRNQEILLSSDQVVFKSRVKLILGSFREELDDHRTAINENTNEIQTTHEYLEALNNKLDNFSARLDELTLIIKGKKDEKTFKFSPLTKREKEVFQAFFHLSEFAPYVTYREIARNLCISEGLVAQYITNMIEKGIPVKKKYYEGKVYFKLEREFRDLQIKKNVLKLNSLLTGWAR